MKMKDILQQKQGVQDTLCLKHKEFQGILDIQGINDISLFVKL